MPAIFSHEKSMSTLLVITLYYITKRFLFCVLQGNKRLDKKDVCDELYCRRPKRRGSEITGLFFFFFFQKNFLN